MSSNSHVNEFLALMTAKYGKTPKFDFIYSVVKKDGLTITIKNVIKEPERKAIEKDIKSYYKGRREKILNIFFLDEKKFSEVDILKIIKVISPAREQRIIAEYCAKMKIAKNKNNKDRIMTIIDSMRRKGLLVRVKLHSMQYGYVPTEAALRVIPHGAYRNSSDISRALAFRDVDWYNGN
ncbi:hypothetical protein [Acidithiobacillus sp. AMEEHan]|jgi:hypothetical protein|uniref:hypothetical protein n=1 Tax=Acidithiobacillus sp. AMEEHan TaxID=2994951 RepID=UPI0027E5935F|nr:hypothetical protein [Acidithiobacillus sp. AMEEHan]